MEGPKEAQKHLEHRELLKEMEAKATAELHEGDQPLGPDQPVEEEDLGQWASEVVNLLTPGHQKKVEKILFQGVGKCPKCKHGVGCEMCDWRNAVRYLLPQDPCQLP